MHGNPSNGQSHRILNVIDADMPLSGTRVTRALIRSWNTVQCQQSFTVKTKSLRSNDGYESTSQEFQN